MFILDKPASKEPTFIFLLLPCADGRLKRSTRLKILPSLWSTDTERPLISKDGKGRALFSVLNRIADTIHKAKDTCLLNNEPFTTDHALSILNSVLSGKQPLHLDFSAAVSLIAEKMKDGTLTTPKNKRFEAATVKSYNRIKKVLETFTKETGISVEFSSVTMQTYEAVKTWCYSKGWSINYTGNILKRWKSILRFGYKLALHRNTIFENKDFKIISEDTEDIYLTLAEIQAIAAVDCSVDKRWQVARDWFLIACYSAFRVSDLKRITSDVITKTSILLVTEKTDEATEVPIHPVVRDILKKWKGPPPRMHENHINKYIKFIARKAGINEKVLYRVTEGGKRKEYYYEKWQMISTHTGRRSFVTNARLLGMPDAIIMKVAAIKSSKTLQRYDKLTTKEAARLASQHAFYKT